jgi:hypothetical protein
MSNKSKYRPYFTADEMLELISALKESPTPSRMKIIQYLEGFNLKITYGVVNANYITNPKPTIEQQLGFTEEEPEPTLSPNEIRQRAYQKWLKKDSTITVKELNLANEYRYENNLMSAEEQAAFEKTLGLSV